MGKNNSSETNPVMSVLENNTDNESERCISTQEEVDKQIRSCNVPSHRQIENLSRLIQEMSTAHRPNFSPTPGTSFSSSTAGLKTEAVGVMFSKWQSFQFT